MKVKFLREWGGGEREGERVDVIVKSRPRLTHFVS